MATPPFLHQPPFSDLSPLSSKNFRTPPPSDSIFERSYPPPPFNKGEGGRFQLCRDRLQTRFLILNAFKQINYLLFSAKSSENHSFFDDFRVNSTYFILLNSLIKSIFSDNSGTKWNWHETRTTDRTLFQIVTTLKVLETWMLTEYHQAHNFLKLKIILKDVKHLLLKPPTNFGKLLTNSKFWGCLAYVIILKLITLLWFCSKYKFPT